MFRRDFIKKNFLQWLKVIGKSYKYTWTEQHKEQLCRQFFTSQFDMPGQIFAEN